METSSTATTSTEITNDGRSLHVTVTGPDDGPPVLLLHGITASGRTWDWLVGDLAQRARVFRADFRGHGGSDRAPGEYTMAGYLADAIAVCEHIGSPCVVVGHSLGGGTAAALAQQRPDLVSAILLEDPPLGVPADLEGNSLIDTFRLMRESIPRLQAEGIDVGTLTQALAAAPGADGRAFGEFLHADGIGAMASGILELDASVLDPVLEGTAGTAFDQDLPIPVPTLLVTADPAASDCVCGPAVVERIQATTPEIQVHVMTGSGHLVHDELDHRAAFRALVLDFVDEHIALPPTAH